MISSYIFHDISPLNYHDISTLSTVSLEVTEVPSVVIQPLGLKPDGLGLGTNKLMEVDGWWVLVNRLLSISGESTSIIQ